LSGAYKKVWNYLSIKIMYVFSSSTI
jgi:hypothetical protein